MLLAVAVVPVLAAGVVEGVVEDDEDDEEVEKKSSKATGAEALGLGASANKLVAPGAAAAAAAALLWGCSCGFIGGSVEGVCAASANAAAKRSPVCGCCGLGAAGRGCDCEGGGGVLAGGFFRAGRVAGTSGSLTGAGCCGSLSKNDVLLAVGTDSIAETHIRSVGTAAAGLGAVAGTTGGEDSGGAAGVTGAEVVARKGLLDCCDCCWGGRGLDGDGVRAEAGVLDRANSW